jgi:allene oxide cyclase
MGYPAASKPRGGQGGGMTSQRFIPLALITAAVGFGVAGCGGDDSSSATAASSGQDPVTLHVIEHANTDTLQHIGPKNEKDSIGDVLGFANPLFNAQNKKQVGSDNGMCIRTAVGKAFECIWTAKLSGGQLTVEGPFYDAKDSVLAITGGTGKYDQASGSMKLHARNAQGTAYDFVYSIIK